MKTALLSKIKLPPGAAKLAAKVSKHSPELALVGGILCFGAACVTAYKDTMKASDVLDVHKQNLEIIKEAKETVEPEKYTDIDYKQDIVKCYTRTSVDMVKSYARTAGLFALGTSLVLYSYNIMRKRNIALAAAYTALENAFKMYRSRVLEEENGLEKDLYYRTGVKTEPVTQIDIETGKKTKQEMTTITGWDGHQYSQYARFFDESCPAWSDSTEFNLTFLLKQQKFANDRLQAYGHVFLNEVYDMLGLPRSTAGQIVGWIMDGGGDNYIDFGIHEGHMASRNFVNGWTGIPTYLLDFNVDGIIYDKI